MKKEGLSFEMELTDTIFGLWGQPLNRDKEQGENQVEHSISEYQGISGKVIRLSGYQQRAWSITQRA